MNVRRELFCGITMLFCVVGCATYNGRPNEPLNMDKVIKPFAEELENNMPKTTTTISPDKRNDYINKLITIIDINYSRFINKLGTEKRTKDMAVDFTQLSLNIAGAAVGGATTKTVLSAISAGVTGSNSAIDKNFFYDLTLPSLIVQMNADRTEVYRMILTGMQKDVSGKDSYPWTMALRDLIDYYNAGTLQHATFSVSKAAGAKQTEAQDRIDGLLMSSGVATPQAAADRGKLTDSLKNITKEKLDDVRGILG